MRIFALITLALTLGCAGTVFVEPGEQPTPRDIDAAVSRCHSGSNVIRHLFLFPLSLVLNEIFTDEKSCQPRIVEMDEAYATREARGKVERLSLKAKRLFKENDCSEFNEEVGAVCKAYKEATS